MNYTYDNSSNTGFDTAGINASLANISMASVPLTPPTVSAAFDVTNSGIYRLFINEAWLGTRLVSNVEHDVIYVRGIATHTDLPEHSGNLFFTVPLVQDPATAHPSDIDLMRSFLCLTGCTAQGPAGLVMNINTTVEQTKRGTSRAVIPSLKGARILVVIKGNMYKDRRYLNPVGFLADDFRSWDEMCRNLPAEQYKAAFGHIIPEGLALKPVERKEEGGGNSQSGSGYAWGAGSYAPPAAAAAPAPAQTANPYGQWQQPAAAPAPAPAAAPAPEAQTANPYGQWQQPAAAPAAASAPAAAPAYSAPNGQYGATDNIPF